jgi:TRAP-type C4-dicarboxylate transport system substrate-binding protein
MSKHHIRWVIAHEPIGLFLKAAERFSKEVNEKTNGAFNIEVLSLTDYAEKYNGGKRITKHDLLDLINSGAIEMSHIYTTWLADYNKDLHALDLPFLFQDHEHADRVLEGDIGTELLAGVTKNSNVRGLSFTYSGGYRIVPAKSAIRNLDDFAGLNLRTSRSPVAVETFKAVGANPMPHIELEEMNEAADAGVIDSGESTYVRIFPLKQNESFGVVNDTKHSLFLTSIIANEDFYNSFDAETKAILQEAALNTAREERRESVRDLPQIIAECEKNNIPVVELTSEAEAKFKSLSKGVYDKFKDYFTPGLVQRIQAAA